MSTSTIQQNILADLDRELAVTRTVLARIPEDKFEYAPHPKSHKLIKLGTHTVNLLGLGQYIFKSDFRDFADPEALKPPPTPTTLTELLERFDKYASAFRIAVNECSEENMNKSFQQLNIGIYGSYFI